MIGCAFDDVSIFVLGDDFGRAIGCSGKDREATSEGFEDDIGEGVVERRKDEKVSALIGFLDFASGTIKVNEFRNPKLFCLLFIAGGIVTANHPEKARMAGITNTGKGFDDWGEPLPLEVLSHKEKLEVGCFLIGGVGGELGVIDPVVDDVDSILRVVVVAADEIFRELGIGNNDTGVLGRHDFALELENGAVSRI